MPKAEPLSRIESEAGKRATAPVFVLGCPRSGTTVLYHMLLSAGNFAIYRAESNVFSVLSPRFGDLRSRHNRQQLLNSWLQSKLFQVTGLNAQKIESLILRDCRTPGDFLRIVMEQTALQQGVQRWADCTPDHLLYIRQIKREIPNALIIHIIRDGRDVALSYSKQGWSHPLPMDRDQTLGVAGLFWEWIVKKGRKYGQELGDDYREVRFEDLVYNPAAVLAELSDFVGQNLDYDRIKRTGIGSVSSPNSSFQPGSNSEEFDPVGRWKSKMSADEIRTFEGLVGHYLRELAYPLATAGEAPQGLRSRYLRFLYPSLFTAKLWLKDRTPFGRLVRVDRMQIAGKE